MFDSQNNAKGGYACPRAVGTGDNTINNKQMYYYEGSVFPIEWTNQHGCGQNGKLNCEVIIQYACEAQLDPEQALRGGEGIYVGAPRDGVVSSPCVCRGFVYSISKLSTGGGKCRWFIYFFLPVSSPVMPKMQLRTPSNSMPTR